MQPATYRSSGFTIIDRYMLRQFVQTFLICFLSLTGLWIVIDGASNLEEFIAEARNKGNLALVIGEYYAVNTVWFYDRIGPLVTLIAAMFTVTWIQRHNELPALEAAGLARGRVVQPVLAAVVVISLASAASREWLMPGLRDKLAHNAQDLGGRTGKTLKPKYDNETSVFIGGPGSKTFGDRQRIESPQFQMPAELGGQRIIGDQAFYESAHDGRPGGYHFFGMKEPKELDRKASIEIDGRPVLLTPRDFPWLGPDECFVASNVTFEILVAGAEFWRLCSTAELIKGLRNKSLDFGTAERLAIHSRIVQPMLDVLLVFLGLPLVLARGNRNVFKAIGWCLVLVTVFMLVVVGCQFLGSSYMIEPALGAWLPLLIFVPIAVALSRPFRE